MRQPCSRKGLQLLIASLSRYQTIVGSLVAVVLTWQYGCAPLQAIPDEVDAQIKTIGVVWTLDSSGSELHTPPLGAAGRGSGLGASYGGATGAFLATQAGPAGLVFMLPAMVAGALVGAPVGAVYGALAAEPAEKRQEPEQVLRSALAELHTPQSLRDFVRNISQIGVSWTRHSFLPLLEQTITVDNRAETYRSLGLEGIDTILELSELTVALDVEELKINNPPLRLIVGIRTRLIQTRDGRVLNDRFVLDIEGRGRLTTEWAADNARLFRAEYARLHQSLPEVVVGELFLLYRIPPHANMGFTFRGGRSFQR